jgi:hypothetical protein
MAAGQGRAYGAALHLQRDGDRVSGQASAEWNRAERRYPGRFDGRYVSAPWEQPFRLTTSFDVRLADGLTAQAHWQGIWGRSWAFRQAYYDYLALVDDGPLPRSTFSRPDQHTLSPYSRVDLGLRGETTVRGVTLEAKVRLVNVFDRRNAFDQSLAPALSRAPPAAVSRTLPGRRAFVLLGIRY